MHVGVNYNSNSIAKFEGWMCKSMFAATSSEKSDSSIYLQLSWITLFEAENTNQSLIVRILIRKLSHKEMPHNFIDEHSRFEFLDMRFWNYFLLCTL